MSAYLPFLLMVSATLSAAVPGVPESPSPGPMPTAWLGLANDSIGLNTGLDDFRTNEVFLAFQPAKRWVVSVDHSMLTSLDEGTRTDELTIAGGYMPYGDGTDESERCKPWLALGLGLRFSGDVFGSELQNSVHRSIGSDTVELAYEENDAHGLAYGLYVYPWFPVPWGGAQVTVSALITSGGEIQSEPAVWGVAYVHDFKFWTGPRARLRGGSRPGPTADAVAEYERGVWLDYGIGWRAWSLSGAYDIAHEHSLGQLTLSLAIP
jgi:hypothetical protein